jgi:hypothetical protein
VPVVSSRSPELAQKLNAVIGATVDFFADAARSDHSADLVGTIREYFIESDRAAVGPSAEMRDDIDDPDRFPSTGPRATLFWDAVSDLLVFRCIGMVDYWAALNESGAILPGEDLDQFRRPLIDDLTEANGFFNEGGLPVAGGSIDDPKLLVQKHMLRIADESASHVLSAWLGALGGFVPVRTPNRVMKVLRRFGRALHLDNLLDWAQRILDLALNKLHRVFGAGFDVIVEPVKSFLEKITGVREWITDSMFQIPHLQDQCNSAIDSINRQADAAQQLVKCADELKELSDRFEKWNKGIDIADESLEWGWRISVIHPPAAVALAAMRGVLSAGAFLIGRYHLDSPKLEFIPWGTHGVLFVLTAKGIAANPEVAGQPTGRRETPGGFGDPGF